MKVDAPRFFEEGDVYCQDCPYADKNGYPLAGCPGEGAYNPGACPAAETYAGHCTIADIREKGSRR